MKKIIFALLLVASFSHAEQIDCGSYKIKSIQAEDGGIIVLLVDKAGKERWKSLGSWQNPSTKPFQAVAQQAFAMDKEVVLRFFYTGQQYSCDETDYHTKPYMIRITQ
ncbi:hypothetical protein [Acinetobacter dispersus]|uniref:hypothetical protein n=1 Tax=Acinetobacter dispersus TaxID=70348 RepID=UPI00132EEE0D|nr:hypothetical protein [Acinetobacter dispersus]QHH96406.1 hypothetical protein FPL17_02190 [Acinetobacter dispersus]